MKHKMLPTVWRVIHFLAMLFFGLLAIFAAFLTLKSFPDWLSLFFSGISTLVFGWATYLLWGRVYGPVARQPATRAKLSLSVTAATIVLLLCLAVALPPYNQYQARARNSDAKHTLHLMFVACKAFWKARGEDQKCDAGTAGQKAHGFVRSAQVTVSGGGAAKDFAATARHEESRQSFTIDARGTIKGKWDSRS
ncbi:MAG: hypothetical protein GWM98_21930 [Nitrospinaceae bacterium]|nr:hypothetical protein [Nitrospinaceae bacterium]NIR56620.1 hypothetical protein [Nitrospinaceae bacterium]NIS87083.1 hypothetical protein [Nitrospinaceae bacterium]NIT83937.1 hypothetical protein [Nitrospinaceae bacterium]NIU46128.1 hypothetical protein [Nitrospinaceae bacterium]